MLCEPKVPRKSVGEAVRNTVKAHEADCSPQKAKFALTVTCSLTVDTKAHTVLVKKARLLLLLLSGGWMQDSIESSEMNLLLHSSNC